MSTSIPLPLPSPLLTWIVEIAHQGDAYRALQLWNQVQRSPDWDPLLELEFELYFAAQSKNVNKLLTILDESRYLKNLKTFKDIASWIPWTTQTARWKSNAPLLRVHCIANTQEIEHVWANVCPNLQLVPTGSVHVVLPPSEEKKHPRYVSQWIMRYGLESVACLLEPHRSLSIEPVTNDSTTFTNNMWIVDPQLFDEQNKLDFGKREMVNKNIIVLPLPLPLSKKETDDQKQSHNETKWWFFPSFTDWLWLQLATAHQEGRRQVVLVLSCTLERKREIVKYYQDHFDVASRMVFVSPEETQSGVWQAQSWIDNQCPSLFSSFPLLMDQARNFATRVETILLQHHQWVQQMFFSDRVQQTPDKMDWNKQFYDCKWLMPLKIPIPVPISALQSGAQAQAQAQEQVQAQAQASSLPDLQAWQTPWGDEVILNDLCIVTGIFAIRAREEREAKMHLQKEQMASVKSVDQYFHHAQRLLDWPVPMIIFTEPQFVQRIWEERKRRGLLTRTMVYPMVMEQSRFWPAVNTLSSHYAQGRIPQGFCSRKDTALYVWSQATKYDCLARALRMNPWKSRSMYWVDFGIYHVVEPPEDLMMLLHQLLRAQRLRVTHLRPLQKQEIANKPQFWSRLQQAAAGGLIGGPLEHVQWLVQHFEKEFVESLQHYPVLDEAILGSLCLQHPNRFFPIHSGHAEMFRLRTPFLTLQQMKTYAQAQDWKAVWDLSWELPSEWDIAQALSKENLVLRAQFMLSCVVEHKVVPETMQNSAIKSLLVQRWKEIVARQSLAAAKTQTTSTATATAKTTASSSFSLGATLGATLNSFLSKSK